MQPSSLAQDIRHAFLLAREDADDELARLSVSEPYLAGLTAERLVATMRERTDPVPLWLALVRAYRAGMHSPLGAVLLEILAPSLVAASIRLQPVPPVITEEDIRQDLVFEAFRALASGALPRDPRWIARHITLRATQAVARHLATEKRRQSHQVSFDADSTDQVEAARRAQPRIQRTQNVRPRAHNVCRQSTIRGTAHVHMRSRGAVRTEPATTANREDALMNTAIDHLRPRHREKGNS